MEAFKENSLNNILITSAGRRVSLVRAFKAEITLIYSGSKVFTTDLCPDFSAACQVADAYFKVGRVTEDNYVSQILAICLNNHVKIVVPTIDTELQILAQNKRLFNENGIAVIISEPDFIIKCRDKRLINDFFVEHEVSIPKPIDKSNPTFPLFIKPYDGSLSKDIFIINTPEELTPYHTSNPKFLFMEYIDSGSHDEYTIDMYYDKNHWLKCLVPRKRIEVRGGEISKGLTVKNEIIKIIREKLKYIEGAIGCLTLQIFFNSEKKEIIGIEINPRFGGGYPLSYLAGANYPKFLIQEYLLNEDITYFESWKENTLMLRYDHEIIVQL